MEKVITVVVVATSIEKTQEHAAVNKYLDDGYTVKSITSVAASTAAVAFVTFVLEKNNKKPGSVSVPQ